MWLSGVFFRMGRELNFDIFRAGLGKQSRSMFMEMDANAARTPQSPQPQPSQPRTPEQRSRNVVAQVAQVSSFFLLRVSFPSVRPVFQIRRTRFDADSLLGFPQLSLTRSDEQVVHERAWGLPLDALSGVVVLDL